VFLKTPPESETAARQYQNDVKDLGFVMNASRLWAWRPETIEAFTAARVALTKSSTLSKREVGVLVCATAASLGDSYCSLAWGKILAKSADAATAAAVILDSPAAGMSAREQALSRWARKVVNDPNATRLEDVEALRAAGLSDQEIFDATTLVAFRLAFSTVNDALGARPDPDLAAAVPPEVRAAVTFGRPVADSV
jgi:uncharacterized peroxidase-related enzyme